MPHNGGTTKARRQLLGHICQASDKEVLKPVYMLEQSPKLSLVVDYVGGWVGSGALCCQHPCLHAHAHAQVNVVNPDEAVALGAAVQAGILQGQVKDLMVMDQWQVGMSLHGGVCLHGGAQVFQHCAVKCCCTSFSINTPFRPCSPSHLKDQYHCTHHLCLGDLPLCRPHSCVH